MHGGMYLLRVMFIQGAVVGVVVVEEEEVEVEVVPTRKQLENFCLGR